jgi:hypothetical protein
MNNSVAVLQCCSQKMMLRSNKGAAVKQKCCGAAVRRITASVKVEVKVKQINMVLKLKTGSAGLLWFTISFAPQRGLVF